jgi:diaminohydroxyphosphoribosylaminopyrimidine deaminase/5-amino-6-(5-phosphoribosylamino)uracil reductase
MISGNQTWSTQGPVNIIQEGSGELLRLFTRHPPAVPAPSQFFPFQLTTENSPTIMHRNTTTFPTTSTNFLPSVGSSVFSTTNQAPGFRHRIDGQVCTIDVTSNVDLFQDTHSFNAIYALANGPNFEVPAKQAIRRTRSDEYRGASFPGMNVVRSRQRSVKSVSGIPKSPAIVSLQIYQHGPPPFPTTRQRVFFYHKNDPYYGFTNFSPHPVMYKNKKYPTSEHLFQSFKVITFLNC